MDSICDDATAEHEELLGFVRSINDADWTRMTPADGWTIADQISHLWFFDQRAAVSLSDPQTFERDKVAMFARRAGGDATDASVELGRTLNRVDVLDRWDAQFTSMIGLARSVDPTTRVAWYGPAMGARSFVTARLMETWAHGQDVYDTLGATRRPTSRLRHVAHIGIGARPFSYAVRGLPMPDGAVNVRLAASDGSTWEWSPDAEAAVAGTAVDFCLLVTQRRHRADTSLIATGDAAVEWLSIAQAFAGPPGPGRQPL